LLAEFRKVEEEGRHKIEMFVVELKHSQEEVSHKDKELEIL